MKKNLFKSVFAVVVGIAGALLLTLNIWGNEWYKVALSTLLGVIIGIFIADPKASLGIFINIGKETWDKTKKFGIFMSTISEKIEAYRLSKVPAWLRDKVGEERKLWDKRERRRKIAVRFYYLIRTLPMGLSLLLPKEVNQKNRSLILMCRLVIRILVRPNEPML